MVAEKRNYTFIICCINTLVNTFGCVSLFKFGSIGEIAEPLLYGAFRVYILMLAWMGYILACRHNLPIYSLTLRIFTEEFAKQIEFDVHSVCFPLFFIVLILTRLDILLDVAVAESLV